MLEPQDATAVAPHVTDLNLISPRHVCVRTTSGAQGAAVVPYRRFRQKTHFPAERNFALAWRLYIRGSIVSRHAKKIITQFMAACCGKSKTEDVLLGEAGMTPDAAEQNEPCDVSLRRVHEILQEVAQGKRTQNEK